MRKGKRRTAAVLLLLAALFPLQVKAAEQTPDPTGSIQVRLEVEKDGKELPISGAHVSVYRVADLEQKEDTALYRLTAPYRSLQKTDKSGRDSTFDGLNADQSADLAAKLARLARGPAASGKTDQEGQVLLSGLEPGMYLTVETDREGTAEKYEYFDPYLVSVPDYQDGKWILHVQSSPKTELTALRGSDNPSSSRKAAVQTGDSENPLPLLLMLAGSGLIAAAAGKLSRELEST